MPVLDNLKHELLVNFIASGQSFQEAGENAGYSPLSCEQYVSAIIKRPEVVARLAEVRAKIASANVMTTMEMKLWLSKLVGTSITDLWDITDDRIVLKQGYIPADIAPFVSEVRLENWQGGKGKRASSTRLVVKLYDKLKAIELLNSMGSQGQIPQALIMLLQKIDARKQITTPDQVTTIDTGLTASEVIHDYQAEGEDVT